MTVARAAPAPPVKEDDEDRVQHNIGDRPDAGDAHAQHRLAGHPDKITEKLGQSLEKAPQRHDAVVDHRIGVGGGGDAEEPEQRVGEEEQKGGQEQLKGTDQHKGVAEGPVHPPGLSLAGKKAETGGAAGAAHEPEGHHHVGQGKTHRQPRQGRGAHPVAHKDPVHNVVDGGDEQGDGRRDGKAQDHGEQRPVPVIHLGSLHGCLLSILVS